MNIYICYVCKIAEKKRSQIKVMEFQVCGIDSQEDLYLEPLETLGSFQNYSVEFSLQICKRKRFVFPYFLGWFLQKFNKSQAPCRLLETSALGNFRNYRMHLIQNIKRKIERDSWTKIYLQYEQGLQKNE